MAWRDVIEQTAVGLGYEVVDIEYSGRGLLRVTIDMPYTPGAPELTITVEDCERVTRQLAFVLEVEGLAYTRLEVSSPGIDRPLRSEKDFERFAGSLVDITLKASIGVAAGDSGVSSQRKKFRGVLEKTPNAWQVVWSTEAPEKPGRRVSKKRPPAPLQALGFSWDEVKEARLAPVVNFKGRSAVQE